MKYFKISTLIIVIISILYSCKHEDDDILFANTRPYVEGKYFETAKGASLKAAAFNDFTLDTQAYSITIRGIISFRDTSEVEIEQFGHVWSTNPNPMYNEDSITIFGGSNTTILSPIDNLKMLTVYYIRSYIKLTNGIIGYNPVTTVVQTITDANIWLPRTGFSGSARRGALSFTLDNQLYIGGGEIYGGYVNDVWRYDPLSMKWSQMANLPGVRGYGVAFVAGGKAFAGLGENLGVNLVNRLDDFYEYKDNSWVTVNGETNPFPGGKRTKAVAFAIGSYGYVGTGDVGAIVKDFKVFDLSEYNAGRDPWEPAPDIGYAREGAAVFVISVLGITKAYVATGIDGEGNYLNDMWEFSQESNNWSSSVPFEGEPRQGAFSFSIIKDYADKGEGYIGGGNDADSIYSDVYMFVPEQNQWIIRAEYVGGPLTDAVSFSAIYQRENESFPTMKGFVTTGFNGQTIVRELYEFLP